MKRSFVRQNNSLNKSNGLIEKQCTSCGSSFKVYPYRAISAKTCSNSCRGQQKRTKIKKNCLFCGADFLFAPSQLNKYKGAGKYCSKDCHYKGIIKETEGKPLKDKYGRSGRKAAKLWKIAVREKDNYTCQRCGIVQKYIHTHHVAPRSIRPDLKYVVSNGKCLCSSCHCWVHDHPKESYALGLLSDASYEKAKKEISWKRSDNVFLTLDDVTLCISEWEKLTGISRGTLQKRKYLGWDDEKILTTPVAKRS